jgi:hypothetical protein
MVIAHFLNVFSEMPTPLFQQRYNYCCRVFFVVVFFLLVSKMPVSIQYVIGNLSKLSIVVHDSSSTRVIKVYSCKLKVPIRIHLFSIFYEIAGLHNLHAL